MIDLRLGDCLEQQLPKKHLKKITTVITFLEKEL